jgi:hypothetical protein
VERLIHKERFLLNRRSRKLHTKESGKAGKAPDRPPRRCDRNDAELPKEWRERRAHNLMNAGNGVTHIEEWVSNASVLCEAAMSERTSKRLLLQKGYY